MTEEKKRILRMLEEGRISVDEAEKLLDKIEGGTAEKTGYDKQIVERRRARALRIIVVEDGEEEVNISIPLKLVKMFETLMPKSAKEKLDEKGINLDVVLDAIEEETVDGKLVDIHDGDTHVEIKLTD